jgi:histone acetyltransferase (RNA polymerase elongator complex component)
MKARRAIIPVFIPHLGCPHRCVFCNQWSTAVSSSRKRSVPGPSEVASAIEEGLSRAGNRAELAFYGGSFTAIDGGLRRSYLEAAYPFIRDGKLSGIRISTRPDAIDEAILDELAGFGVGTIELGAQSMDDDVLRRASRGHSARDTVEVSRLIKDRGFSLVLQMMVGLPGERPGSAFRTAGELAALSPDGVRVFPTVVIRGTGLEKLWEQGEYSPLSLENAAEICADLLEYFEGQSIHVIRIGLNPTEGLEGDVLAGPYHPAFGEMCLSLLYLKKARALLDVMGPLAGKSVVFGVEAGRTSAFVGQHKGNTSALKREYGLREIKVRETGPDPGTDPGRGNKIKVEIVDVYW